MAIAFVAAGTVTLENRLYKPAGLTPGDMMIAGVAAREGINTGDIFVTGWTKIAHALSTDPNSSSITAFWKVAEASDPSFWSPSIPVVNMRTCVLGYSGVDPTEPVDDFSENDGRDTSIEFASVTPTGESMLVGMASHLGTTASVPAGATMRWLPALASSGQANGHGWEKAVSAGATGTLTGGASGNSGNGWASLLIALQPLRPRWDVGTIGWGAREAWS